MRFHSINLGPWFRVTGIEQAHFDRMRDSMRRQTPMHPPAESRDVAHSKANICTAAARRSGRFSLSDVHQFSLQL
jgi:hypothetical protein